MATAEDLAKALHGVIGANDEEATVKHFLDTGFPVLNHALSGRWDGGFPGGRVIEISGPPSAGKTAIATAAMAAAQRAGGIAGFNDHERSFSLRLAPNLGLNVAPGKFIYKKPETYEASVNLIIAAATLIREKGLIAPDAPIAWVLDSLAAMVPYEVLYDSKGKPRGMEDRNMRDNLALAAANSAHLPALAQKAEDLGICLIVLNQLRTKPGVMYGDPTYTPGGNAKEFYYSQRLRLSAAKIESADKKSIIGQEVTCTVTKNKVCRPFLKASWRFMFQNDGSGRFDVERSMVDFLASQSILEDAGPGFVKWDGKRIGKEALARKIEAEKAFGKLKELLPKEYEPETVAEVAMEAAE
jgi:protein RecA